MNQARRKRLNTIISQLEDLQTQIEEVTEEEREAFDNMPESIQGSEKGEQMEEFIQSLEDASADVDSVIEKIQEVTEV